MTKLQILGVSVLVLMMGAPNLTAQRRGGGVARSGMRGAAVGGLFGGSSGARKGAKAGVAVGVTRNVVDRSQQRRAVDSEAQARAQYQASAEYQSTQRSNFHEAPPQVLGASPSMIEAVIRRDGKPVLGISYPSDWKQTPGDHRVSAVSLDGQVWSVIATLHDVKDKEAGIAKIKTGLANYLQDIKYDELTKSQRGALVVTGTGKGKKAGVDVVFAAGVFDSGKERLSGVAFIVDASIEENYKETVRVIAQSIRVEKDFAEKVQTSQN